MNNIEKILGNNNDLINYYGVYTIILILLIMLYKLLVKKNKIKENKLYLNYLNYLPLVFGIDIIYRFVSLGESYIYVLYIVWFFRYLLPYEKNWSIQIRRILATLVITFGVYNLLQTFNNNYGNFQRQVDNLVKIINDTISNLNGWYLVLGTMLIVLQRILFSRTWVYIIESIHGNLNRKKMMVLHALTELPRYIPGISYLNMLSRIYILKKQGIKEVNSLLSFIYERKYNIIASVLIIILLLDKNLFSEIIKSSKIPINNYLNDELFVLIQLVLLTLITLLILMYPKYLANFTQKLSLKLFNDKVEFKASKKQLNFAFIIHIVLAYIYALGYYFQFKSLVPSLVFNIGLVASIYTISQIAGSIAKDVGKVLILPIRYAIIITLLKTSGVYFYSEQAYNAAAVTILAFQGLMFYVSVIIYQLLMITYALIVREDIKELIKEVFSFKKKKVKTNG